MKLSDILNRVTLKRIAGARALSEILGSSLDMEQWNKPSSPFPTDEFIETAEVLTNPFILFVVKKHNSTLILIMCN